MNQIINMMSSEMCVFAMTCKQEFFSTCTFQHINVTQLLTNLAKNT